MNDSQLNSSKNVNPVSSSDSDNDNYSSTFILDQYSDEINEEENRPYELKLPLCVSQIYRKDFFHYYHINYYGELEDEEPFLASVRYISSEDDDRFNLPSSSSSSLNDTTNDHHVTVRAIIRTSKEDYDITETTHRIEDKELLERLFDKVHLSNIKYYNVVQDLKGNEIIYKFDKTNAEQQSFKIGFISQCSNQSNETEILSNNSLSSDAENFLNLLADRIELKGFDKYRGDLDTKSNEHGDYSYFTIFHDHQIMFNVAPIIPSHQYDHQFIQRKSLVANALLCIVFQEENSIFQPKYFTGKVIQAYVTVQPITMNDSLYYKIRIWRRSHLKSKIEPRGGIYKYNQSFRHLFLILILNTINSILEKGFIHSKLTQQIERCKSEQLKKLFSKFNDTYQQKTISNPYNRPKQHHSKLLPKLSEAFHKVRSMSVYSSSDSSLPSLFENQTSSNKFNYPSKFFHPHKQFNSTDVFVNKKQNLSCDSLISPSTNSTVQK